MMNQLNVGDVVYLNSNSDIKMTIKEISGDGVECVYFNPETGKVTQTPPLPEDAVTKVG